MFSEASRQGSNLDVRKKNQSVITYIVHQQEIRLQYANCGPFLGAVNVRLHTQM